MSQEQAQRLLETVGTHARVHQIGNGEHVVIVRRKLVGDYYLWESTDWAACQKEVPCTQQARK